VNVKYPCCSTLREQIESTLHQTLASPTEGVRHDEHSTEDNGHGRVENRHCTILIDPKGLAGQDEWEKLRVIGMYVRERQVGDAKPTIETSYFIGSKVTSAKNYLKALRNHWGIENNLHWQLDVTFGEDANRVTKRSGGTGAQVGADDVKATSLEKKPCLQTGGCRIRPAISRRRAVCQRKCR